MDKKAGGLRKSREEKREFSSMENGGKMEKQSEAKSMRGSHAGAVKAVGDEVTGYEPAYFLLNFHSRANRGMMEQWVRSEVATSRPLCRQFQENA